VGGGRKGSGNSIGLGQVVDARIARLLPPTHIKEGKGRLRQTRLMVERGRTIVTVLSMLSLTELCAVAGAMAQWQPIVQQARV